MEAQLRSRLWVYTGRDDLLHASSDAGVQERYRRCVVGAGRYYAVYCVLRYLLEEADFPKPVEKPGKVYVYTVVHVKSEEGSRRRILSLQADGCSLLNVVAIADAGGLTYAEAQRVLASNTGSLVFLAPPSLQYVVDYDGLGQVLGQGAGWASTVDDNVVEEALLRIGALKRAVDVGVSPNQCLRDNGS